MCFSLEYEIVRNINKKEMTYEDSLKFIDSLYWANWDMLRVNFSDQVYKILDYLCSDNFDEIQTDAISKLYRVQI